MIDNDFEFIIGSPTDREKLICEIFYKEEILAEISQETNQLMIEIYPPQKNAYWILEFDKFQNALETGKKHLLGQR